MRYDGWGWKPYVSAAERKRKAKAALQKRFRTDGSTSPVFVTGRTIASTFWGKAWCANLERYSDYENRLPRGRTYVRQGCVIDLQVKPGRIEARVSGSSLYKVSLEVEAVPATRWKSICGDCAGGIDSLVELLQGRLSKGVMERICRESDGLFPSPREIRLSCSCPDWAEMCKHVAAVMYGVGARLDREPELLFLLRGVDQRELIAKAGERLRTAPGQAGSKVLAGGDLADLFGIEMVDEAAPGSEGAKAKAGRKAVKKAAKKAVKKAAKKAAVKGAKKAARKSAKTVAKKRSAGR